MNNFISLDFTISMPKTTYVQKSREFEYQKVGKNASKQQYKLVAIPPKPPAVLPGKSVHTAPTPTINPPDENFEGDVLLDIPLEEGPKSTGKVVINHHIVKHRCFSLLLTETIGLHEGMA